MFSLRRFARTRTLRARNQARRARQKRTWQGEPLENRHLLAAVALFANNTFNDLAGIATPGDTSDDTGEALQVQQSLEFLGHDVARFGGISQTELRNVLLSNQALVIPELENGNLTAALSNGAKDELRAFVSGGGSIILFGSNSNNNEIALLVDVFGIAVAPGTDGTAGTDTLTPAASTTMFRNGPSTISENNSTSRLLTTSLPAGSKSIYANGSFSTVATMPYGFGQLIYLGWDWFGAAPSPGTANGGWLTALDLAVDQATTLSYDSAASENLLLQREGDGFRIRDASTFAILAQKGASQTNNILITGGTNLDSVLTVNYDGGPIQPPITYNAGGGASATDRLTVRGGVFNNTNLFVSGSRDGTLEHDGAPIFFTGVETLEDVARSDNFTHFLTNAADSVVVDDGPSVLGDQTQRIRPTNDTFSTVHVARKRSVTVNSLAGADTITVSALQRARDLDTLTVETGSTDGDVVNVTAWQVRLKTSSTSGSDTVNIGSSGIVANIRDEVTVTNVGGRTALNINASAEAAARDTSIRPTTVEDLTPQRVIFTANELSSLTVTTTASAEQIRVDGTPAGIPTIVNAGGGNDNITVDAGLLSTTGTLTINGQTGTDTLTMRGGSFGAVDQLLTGLNEGNYSHDGRRTFYTGVETAHDITIANAYSLTSTLESDVASVLDGPLVAGLRTTQFLSTNSLFGTVNVANKPSVTFLTSSGADVVTVNNPGGAAGLTSLTINTGADADTVNVLATRELATTQVTNPSGLDTVNVGNAGLLNAILGAFKVEGSQELTALIVDGSATPGALTVTVTDNAVTGLAPSTISYSETAIRSLTLNSGAGADTWNITSTAEQRTTTVRSGNGNDTFNITAAGLGEFSINNFSGQGGDDTFTSGFSVTATINVDGGPQAVADVMRYDLSGLDVVLMASSVGAAGRQPINIVDIERQELIGLSNNIQSITVQHSPLGGVSKITTTADPHDAIIQVQGGATYYLFDLRNNIPIFVNGSFLDDRLEIINTGAALLDAEITFEGAQNSSIGDSLSMTGGGNLVVNETHNATGPKAGNFNLDNVMTVTYANIEAQTDSLLTFGLTYNTPANQADQLSYGDGATIPESHRITSGNNAFLAYEFASKVEVTVNTGTGGSDGGDQVSVATTIDMPLMTILRVQTGAGADTVTLNTGSPLPSFFAELSTGATDKLVILASDLADTYAVNSTTVSGAPLPIEFNANTEELEIFGRGGDDTFNITPSTATRFTIHGDGQDTADKLLIDALGQSVNAGKASITVQGRQPINYDGIEEGEITSSAGPIPSLILTHDAAGGASNLHFGDTSHDAKFQVQGGTTFKIDSLGVAAIVQLQGNTGDDRLDVVHDGQAVLDAFLDFFGGTAGNDTLAFSGNQPPLDEETHQPSGPHAGLIDFSGPFSARYADLDVLEDALPVTKLTWNAAANLADQLFYENGVFNSAAHQIRSGNNAFVTHQFVGKTNVIVRTDNGAGDLADTLDVNVSQTNTGLATLEFFTGAGDDVTAITLGAALPPTTLHAGAGANDQLTVRGTAGDDTLTVDEFSVTGAGSSVTFDTEVEVLRVDGGDGNDAINVVKISAALVPSIFGGAGNDTVTVQAPLPATLTFDDGDGDDRLILVGTDADEEFHLGGTTVTGAGATINYLATLEHLETRGQGGRDEFFVAPNDATEYFVDGGTPTGTLPGDRLEVDFAGTTGRKLSFTGPGAGAWTFTNRKQVGFTDIEEFNYFDLLAAGADAGATSSPAVQLLDALTLEETIRLMAYEANYQEGVRVALGDLNGDGVPELITAPGRSRAPKIRVFDVTSGAELTQYRFLAYDSGFVGGVYVAAGDVDGDGRNDIIVSAGRGPSNVRVFRNNSVANASAPFAGGPYREFSPFGTEFIGGATVAAADFTGDGKAEVIVGSGTGMRSTVRIYDVRANATSYTPLRQMLPFDAEFRGGVFVSAGRINGDGVPDVIVTQGPSGDARVELFDGLSGASFVNFDGYTDSSSTSPIRGVGADLDGDGTIERIITSQGPDGRTNLIRRFTTNGSLVDQVVETEPQFLSGFHLASFFANKEVLASTGNVLPTSEEIVTKLYQQVLGRSPEPAGLQYWVDKINAGASYGTVASGIFESAERLDPIIRQFYRDYLLREAEPAGVTFYRELWQKDGSPDNVVANIISSAEFFASAGGTNVLWVTELYRRLLGREPDGAGLDYWTSRLESGQLTRKQVVFGFTLSNENFTNLINGWYQLYLGRTPTAEELASRVERMRAGATQRDIQIELIDSPEYALTV